MSAIYAFDVSRARPRVHKSRSMLLLTHCPLNNLDIHTKKIWKTLAGMSARWRRYVMHKTQGPQAVIKITTCTYKVHD